MTFFFQIHPRFRLVCLEMEEFNNKRQMKSANKKIKIFLALFIGGGEGRFTLIFFHEQNNERNGYQ